VRQGEPLGLGHAISVARKHVGDNPFAVLLGDEWMSEDTPLLEGMIATYERYNRSVIALQEVSPEEISRYGCAKPEPVSDNLVQILDLVEKPEAAAAPSNLAVMGRYVLTPQIFEALERIEPGSGGELQLTDAIALLLQSQAVYGYTFTEGRYDTGQVLDYLKVIVELASERDDLGPEFRTFLADFVRERDF
jgi:UTP--glucose-1-phosphate uridylyltransferase